MAFNLYRMTILYITGRIPVQHVERNWVRSEEGASIPNYPSMARFLGISWLTSGEHCLSREEMPNPSGPYRLISDGTRSSKIFHLPA